jgi:hypothetical protein
MEGDPANLDYESSPALRRLRFGLTSEPPVCLSIVHWPISASQWVVAPLSPFHRAPRAGDRAGREVRVNATLFSTVTWNVI